MSSELGSELEKLIKEAQKQPGIADIMAFHAQCGELLQKNSPYFEAINLHEISSYSANST